MDLHYHLAAAERSGENGFEPIEGGSNDPMFWGSTFNGFIEAVEGRLGSSGASASFDWARRPHICPDNPEDYDPGFTDLIEPGHLLAAMDGVVRVIRGSEPRFQELLPELEKVRELCQRAERNGWRIVLLLV